MGERFNEEIRLGGITGFAVSESESVKTPDFTGLLKVDISSYIRSERPDLTDEEVETVSSELLAQVVELAEQLFGRENKKG